MAKKFVFDSESDGLALEATRLHIVCIEDYDTGETWEYLEGDLGWQKKLEEATHLIGHNIVEHDFPLMEKLTDWVPPAHVKIQDTLIMSRAQDYNRFGNYKHAMELWGEYLGKPKQEHEDWSVFTEEMRQRCRSDVKLNCLMYKELLGEFYSILKKQPLVCEYILCEHAASKWVGMSHMNGWPFDIPAAKRLQVELEEVVERVTAELEPKLGCKAVAKDKKGGEIEVKSAKWVASGAYHSHTAAWFDVDPWSG